MNDIRANEAIFDSIDPPPDEIRVRERVERLVREAEGLRVAAAWMLQHRRELAEFGVGDFGVSLYGGADGDELKFFLYGNDAAKQAACDHIRRLIPDLKWEDDSTHGKVGVCAEIIGGMSVSFYGTRDK